MLRRRNTATTSPWGFAVLLLAFVSVQLASADDDAYVSCGSAIKIQQKETSYFLHSEEKSLGSGSGQQIVTFYNDKSTHDALWRVRPANHNVDGKEYPDGIASCQVAQPIPCGTVIRLTHLSTNRNLHSHGVESVLSRQQEVTGYGTGDGKGDGGDDWMVECAGSNKKYWERSAGFRLLHQDTGKYLGTSKNTEFNEQTCGHSCPIMGHLEAFGRSAPDAHTLMTIEQGIHLSK